MDNRTAFWLALTIIVFFLVDHFYLEWGVPLIIGKLTASLSEWLAFWR